MNDEVNSKSNLEYAMQERPYLLRLSAMVDGEFRTLTNIVTLLGGTKGHPGNELIYFIRPNKDVAYTTVGEYEIEVMRRTMSNINSLDSGAYNDALKQSFKDVVDYLPSAAYAPWTVVTKNHLSAMIPIGKLFTTIPNESTPQAAQQPENEEVLKNRIYRALVGIMHKSFVCEEDRAKAIAKYMVNDKGE